MLHTLDGFEVSSDGFLSNFILSNGERSYQRDKDLRYFTHLIPAEKEESIKSVNIYYHNGGIYGLSFFAKDKLPFSKTGRTEDAYLKVKKVVLEDDEVIIGVVAKLFGRWQSVFTDF